VGKSDDSGVFSVNNLRPNVYKLFALKDGNNNLLFDLPTEEIAFLDTSLILNAEFTRSLLMASGKIDSTVLIDTVNIVDSLTGFVDTTDVVTDSIKESGPDLNSIYVDLLLFMEETNIQYITDYSRDQRRKLEMVFSMPLTDSFNYRPISELPDEDIELLEYFSPRRDSLTLWIKDSMDYKKDTLEIELNFTVKDTTDQYVIQKDTLMFSFREKNSKKKKEGSEENEKEKLHISTIRNNRQQHLNQPLVIDLEFPLLGFNDSLISLYHISDSVEIPEPFQVLTDSLLLTRGWISANWKSAEQYRMVLLPGAITSIYPLEHDTIDVTFKTRNIEYYGQILLNLENVKNHVIIQLINKDKVIRERGVNNPGLYNFSYLSPEDYNIKFIHDLNGNGKWDTGKYMEKLQPEPVELLPVGITVRSNWDHDITMKLEK
jgi:hypothetical protein